MDRVAFVNTDIDDSFRRIFSQQSKNDLARLNKNSQKLQQFEVNVIRKEDCNFSVYHLCLYHCTHLS